MSNINEQLNLIRTSSHSISEQYINILLVDNDARDATLLEYSNVLWEHRNNKNNIDNINTYKQYIKKFLNLCRNRLYIKYDNLSIPDYPRYFISKNEIKEDVQTDEQIGKILDMHCYDKFPSNMQDVKTITGIIYCNFNNQQYSLFTEVCVYNKVNEDNFINIINNKAEEWNKTLQNINKEFNVNTNFIIKLSQNKYYEILDNDDKKTIMENKNVYEDYAYNSQFIELGDITSKLLNKEDNIKDYEWQFFKDIMKFTKKDDEDFQSSMMGGNNNYHNIYKFIIIIILIILMIILFYIFLCNNNYNNYNDYNAYNDYNDYNVCNDYNNC